MNRLGKTLSIPIVIWSSSAVVAAGYFHSWEFAERMGVPAAIAFIVQHQWGRS